MASNFCPNCGARLQYPEAEICPSCGVRIKPPPLPPGDLYPGFWPRAFAYIIDTIITGIPSGIIVFLLIAGSLSDAMNSFSGSMDSMGDLFGTNGIGTPSGLNPGTMPDLNSLNPSSLTLPDLGSVFASLMLAFLEVVVVFLVIRWVYFAYMESSLKQATFGKEALGLMVIDGEGHRISFARATGRWFGKLISWATFGIGFYLIGFTEKKQGLHDLIADTRVVYRNRFQESR
ncbi:MAG TPA: RDD family protein [Methanomicrobiales archaeon]|nr:RDD family protein [Methanomicrobiales archaeon]